MLMTPILWSTRCVVLASVKQLISKQEKIVDYGIEALMLFGAEELQRLMKIGDGAGIQIEIAPDFFKDKILATGHNHMTSKRISVGMVFLPKDKLCRSRKTREIIESVLLEENF